MMYINESKIINWKIVYYFYKKHSGKTLSQPTFSKKEADWMKRGNIPHGFFNFNTKLYELSIPHKISGPTHDFLVRDINVSLKASFLLKKHGKDWYKKNIDSFVFIHILAQAKIFLSSPQIIEYMKNQEFNKFLTTGKAVYG